LRRQLRRHVGVARLRRHLDVHRVPQRVRLGGQDLAAEQLPVGHGVALALHLEQPQLGLEAHVDTVGDEAPRRAHVAGAPGVVDQRHHLGHPLREGGAVERRVVRHQRRQALALLGAIAHHRRARWPPPAHDDDDHDQDQEGDDDRARQAAAPRRIRRR
jgi:hypothetical protein